MNFANFFQAIAMIASQEIDSLTLDNETVQDWLELDAAFMVAMEVYHGLEEIR